MNPAGAVTEIKEKSISIGARVVGIASVESINQYAPSGHRPDEEIATKLGLTVGEATEIRCIAEKDNIALSAYLDAEGTKERRFKLPPGRK